MAFTSTGLYAQWQTSEPRYSYEDYRELRIAIESRNRVQALNESDRESLIKKRQSSNIPQKKKTARQQKSNLAAPQKSSRNSVVKYKRYTVKKGDTLYRIAHKYSVGYTDICRANSLKDKDVIYAGMRLKIPAKGVKKDTSRKNITTLSGRSPHFNWPLKKILSYKRDGGGGVKSIGIIIKSRANAPVYPAASGVVKKVGEMRGFGKYVVVTHGDRYITVYSNLKNISVSAGDRVEKSSYMGNINDNDILHFQIDHAGKPRNPLNYLPKRS